MSTSWPPRVGMRLIAGSGSHKRVGGPRAAQQRWHECILSLVLYVHLSRDREARGTHGRVGEDDPKEEVRPCAITQKIDIDRKVCLCYRTVADLINDLSFDRSRFYYCLMNVDGTEVT